MQGVWEIKRPLLMGRLRQRECCELCLWSPGSLWAEVAWRLTADLPVATANIPHTPAILSLIPSTTDSTLDCDPDANLRKNNLFYSFFFFFRCQKS